MKVDKFPFHKLLQDTNIPELNTMINKGITEFTFSRKGTYCIVTDKPDFKKNKYMTYEYRTKSYYLIAK